MQSATTVELCVDGSTTHIVPLGAFSDVSFESLLMAAARASQPGASSDPDVSPTVSSSSALNTPRPTAPAAGARRGTTTSNTPRARVARAVTPPEPPARGDPQQQQSHSRSPRSSQFDDVTVVRDPSAASAAVYWLDDSAPTSSSASHTIPVPIKSAADLEYVRQRVAAQAPSPTAKQRSRKGRAGEKRPPSDDVATVVRFHVALRRDRIGPEPDRSNVGCSASSLLMVADEVPTPQPPATSSFATPSPARESSTASVIEEEAGLEDASVRRQRAGGGGGARGHDGTFLTAASQRASGVSPLTDFEVSDSSPSFNNSTATSSAAASPQQQTEAPGMQLSASSSPNANAPGTREGTVNEASTCTPLVVEASPPRQKDSVTTDAAAAAAAGVGALTQPRRQGSGSLLLAPVDGMGSRQLSSLGGGSKTPLASSLSSLDAGRQLSSNSVHGDFVQLQQHAQHHQSLSGDMASLGSGGGGDVGVGLTVRAGSSELSRGSPQQFSSSGNGGGGGPVASSSSNVLGGTPKNSLGQPHGVADRREVRTWRYKKEKLIGHGADGKVFKAFDQNANEYIAVKDIFISPATENGDTHQEHKDNLKISLIKKQIELLRRLPPHPNVVQHKGIERTTCSLSIMMEYVAGGSINGALSTLGAFSETVVRTYARHICTGLAFLHSHGVIHRDIKAANILITSDDGTLKIADFGACLIHSMVEKQEDKKKGIIGTSMWMSPECIQSHDVTDKTDIWSLGCTIIEMATGKPPWHEAHFTNEWAAMFYISQSGRGPPIPTHLSRQAHAFLKRCFAIDPANRPSAVECLDDPFLTETFEPSSARPEMRPPSPSELLPPHQFPNAGGGGGGGGTGKHAQHLRASGVTTASLTSSLTTDNEYATSNYSTFSFAVYDAEWGARETEDDGAAAAAGGLGGDALPDPNQLRRSGNSNNSGTTTPRGQAANHVRAMGAGNRTPRGAATSLPPLPRIGSGVGGFDRSSSNATAAGALGDNGVSSAPQSDQEEEDDGHAVRDVGNHHHHLRPGEELLLSRRASGGFSRHNTPSQQHVAHHSVTATAPATSGTGVGEVSHDAIATFIAQTANTTVMTASMANAVLDDQDDLGFGLPEAVLYTVFHFLDAAGLCNVGAVSRRLQEMVDWGAKEVLWKHLFLQVFGDVDPVRMAQRKNWKLYYKNSVVFSELLSHERFTIHRQLCQSAHVFEGFDTTTGEPVVIKVEPWTLQAVKAKKSNSFALSSAAAQLNLNTDFSGTYELPARVAASTTVAMSSFAASPQASATAAGVGGTLRTPSKQRSLPPTPTKSSANSTPSSSGALSNLASPLRPAENTTPGTTASGVSAPISHPYTFEFLSPSALQAAAGSPGGSSISSQRQAGGPATTTVGTLGRPPLVAGGLSRNLYSRNGSTVVSVGGVAPPIGALGGVNLFGAGPHGGSTNNSATRDRGSGNGSNNDVREGVPASGGTSPPPPAPPAPSAGPTSASGAGHHHLPSLPLLPPPPPSSFSPSSNGATAPVGGGGGGLPPQIPRGRLLPRAKARQPTPSHPVTIPQALSPFASRRAASPQLDGASAQVPIAMSPGAMSNAQQMHVSRPDSSFGFGGSASPQQSQSQYPPPSRQPSWSDLYEYQRVTDGVAAGATPSSVATTLAPVRPVRSLLQHQYKVIRHLEAMGCQFIPRPLAYSDADALHTNILVTNALGPSLNELLLFCGNQLSLRTVAQLTLRLLRVLEQVHEHDVVHGGITPTNIVIGGALETMSDLFLINFSQSRYFRDPRTHRPTTTSTTSAATARARSQEFLSFCSTFVQRGCTPAPRDDIIAIGYVLCYLVHGGLPWIHEGKLNSQEVISRKNSYLEILSRTPPIQLHYFLKSGYALKQGEVPDFPYLTNLVNRMMRDRGWVDDGHYDWTPQVKEQLALVHGDRHDQQQQPQQQQDRARVAAVTGSAGGHTRSAMATRLSDRRGVRSARGAQAGAQPPVAHAIGGVASPTAPPSQPGGSTAAPPRALRSATSTTVTTSAGGIESPGAPRRK